MLGLALRQRTEARALAADISRVMRDAAYAASIESAQRRKARSRCSMPKNSSPSRTAPRACRRRLKAEIRKHGIRNSHLLSIAPTGTISLAFAGNASGGIEPTFSWTYIRKKRMPDGSKQEYVVEDYAYRLFRRMGGDESKSAASLRQRARDERAATTCR